jgi:deazaflavin-dependent oxidoreductase (nitroreductase family)
MAKTYRVTPGRRIVNTIATTMLRLGVPINDVWLLTVTGRKTGTPYTIPITLIIKGEQRWLVAPYGPVSWVRNLRAAGEGVLSRGGHHERIVVQELEAHDAAPILKQYLQKVSVVRPYFDVTYESPLPAIEAEAAQHPVFLVTESNKLQGKKGW